MAEGTDVSRAQLSTFVSKADAAAQQLQGAVSTLENELMVLDGNSAGAFAAKFRTVKAEINNEMTVMNRALSATSADSNTVVQKYTAGDEDQAQQVATAGDGVSGIASGRLPV